MAYIVGVRFRRAGKIYYFDPSGIELKLGDSVVVETSGGPELGKVVLAPTEIADDEIYEPFSSR